MKRVIELDIATQPSDETCGPTCLQAVYGHYNDGIPLERVVAEVDMLAEGGTLAAYLANHALARGYNAHIYSYNLTIFDPTWAQYDIPAIRAKLELQLEYKQDPKLHRATEAYFRFFDLGGQLHFDDLSSRLISHYIKRGNPIIVGLSATYLYRCPRETATDYDDLRGEACGHFVVICGYDSERRTVRIADPLLPNPVAPTNYYEVPMNRLIGAIFLGVMSYDAKLLVIEPGQ